MESTMHLKSGGAAEQLVVPFLDGVLSHSESDTGLEVIDPFNGKRVVSIPSGSEGDVNRAVASARRALLTGDEVKHRSRLENRRFMVGRPSGLTRGLETI